MTFWVLKMVGLEVIGMSRLDVDELLAMASVVGGLEDTLYRVNKCKTLGGNSGDIYVELNKVCNRVRTIMAESQAALVHGMCEHPLTHGTFVRTAHALTSELRNRDVPEGTWCEVTDATKVSDKHGYMYTLRPVLDPAGTLLAWMHEVDQYQCEVCSDDVITTVVMYDTVGEAVPDGTKCTVMAEGDDGEYEVFTLQTDDGGREIECYRWGFVRMIGDNDDPAEKDTDRYQPIGGWE
jgi:hypothetical protein